MEVIDYIPPKSWNDKDMNWSNPDPANINYVIALREALVERANTVQVKLDERLWHISPYRPLTVQTMDILRSALNTLIPKFVNRDFDDYKEDLSNFPKMWTLTDLITKECNIAEHPGPGSLIASWQTWFKAMRDVINRLTCVPFYSINGISLARSGAEHDPPF